MKRLIVAILAVLCTLGVSAQEFTGGVKGHVVSRADKSSIEGAVLTLYQGGEAIAETKSDAEGNFLIGNLANGIYDLVIAADEYLETRVNVTVNDGYVKNMFNLSMTPSHQVSDAEDDNFVEFDMDDSGYNDNPTILFGQNDVFNSIAGYNFSAVRFRARGYSSESQNVYLAGVKMNDAITGYSPYSLWSGLNEATRAKDSFVGAEMADFGIGGYNGLVNINGNASNVRKGWRASLLTNSALYRLRLMLTYASGPLDNGWSYAFSASARLGGNDWIDGVYYRSFGYYASAEKKFDDVHKLGFIFMATPGQRGAQNASTQEVYDLMGDNMYNSNWGYQNGKVRNARVRITNEPIAVIKYDFTPQDNFSASATVLYRFGKNGYTALDWNNAQDPRPDYYRNLPSYFWMENPDYNRNNFTKWAWATETWGYSRDPELVHVNWDRLYNVNRMNRDYGLSRSKYILEERRVDQRDLNLAISAKWKPSEVVTLNAGVNGKINRTEHYKIINDLLGGDYYLNVDSFAERDFSAFPYMIQNDMDYWMEHGYAQVLEKGDKFGYDYYAQIRQAQLWA
ncbi:MAG: carboxypeptidase regulatory-like domain-containing protein, partial [Bacteroidales bacterium]|nr:carboxypeptidase regulatory-like domain-containing protein [Bacteroidales bacterium]